MPSPDSPAPTPPLLRLWPGVTAASLLLLVRFVIPIFWPETLFYGVLASGLLALAILVWWLFWSRAPWLDRGLGAALLVAAVFLPRPLLHPSIEGGMMGMMYPIYVAPFLCLAFVGAVVAGRRLSTRGRRLTVVAAIVAVCGAAMLVRTGGMTGGAASDFAWRWSPTPEERLLAQGVDPPIGPPPPDASAQPEAGAEEEVAVEGEVVSAAGGEALATEDEVPIGGAAAGDIEAAADVEAAAVVAASAPEWPGFRGPERDGVVRGARIAVDWSASPPVELWRRPIGPGWSSFAVDGDRLYTQEQLGDDEIVACYDAATGAALWRHADKARFWESNGGAGPRGTPSLHDGRVYALGATGLLNALDAADGRVLWSRDVAAETSTEVPTWGISGSPLVVDDLVVVAVSGRLAAYDRATGEPRWRALDDGGVSYSSPHLATVAGVRQILFLNERGASSVAPADGKLLWQSLGKGSAIIQPALTADGDLLLSADDGQSLRRVALSPQAGGWNADERWKTTGLKPYFNDLVVHEGHAYGFDGSILACIDLATGERRWKGGRYGSGQLVLLPEQDLLLVLGEKGELALVAATPERFSELGRVPGLQGKTWNHPVVAGHVLLVRNGEEMAAFRLGEG